MHTLTPFERLTALMTSLDGFDVQAIFATLAELCIELRVSKGVTTFYPTLEDEANGNGKAFVCYDNGKQHNLVSRIRLVTPAHVVIACDVYQAEGDAPFTESEKLRVEIIQRMMVTYLNRTRQEEIIERVKYLDGDGYHNLRYYYDQIMLLQASDALAGKTAARINLKRFTLVNEQVGKEAGDIVLRRYIEALRDAMGPDSVLSRLGGDNFVLLFDTENTPAVEKY